MDTKEIIFLILAFVVAFVFSFAATPIAYRLAFKIGAVDVPRDSRRMHKTPHTASWRSCDSVWLHGGDMLLRRNDEGACSHFDRCGNYICYGDCG